MAEVTAIINALKKAHVEGVTHALMAEKLPDSEFHRTRRASWIMDTMRMMEKLGMREHEIFSFHTPTALPDRDNRLRECLQILRSLIEQYMREKQC